MVSKLHEKMREKEHGWDKERGGASHLAGPEFSCLRSVEFIEVCEKIHCRDIYSVLRGSYQEQRQEGSIFKGVL